MKIGIINYGAGNIKSVANALNKLNKKIEIIKSPKELKRVDKIILPGVGSASSAMEELRKFGLVNSIKALRKPFLGICLGMQLLADFSEEGYVKCLGIIPGNVKKFQSNSLKIPQIGWNKIQIVKKSPLFKNIEDGSYFYFVNSYYFDAPENFILCRTAYGCKFPSAICKDNFYAVQFHPEKSGEAGMILLSNFCEKC